MSILSSGTRIRIGNLNTTVLPCTGDLYLNYEDVCSQKGHTRNGVGNSRGENKLFLKNVQPTILGQEKLLEDEKHKSLPGEWGYISTAKLVAG